MFNISEHAKLIFTQMSDDLKQASQSGVVVGNALEKGLGNEVIFRELLKKFLPKKFGVGKGKIINATGGRSLHLDVIIYDAINCPNLYVDRNDNLFVPIEGVYYVIEVKTTLDSVKLNEAFKNLNSVHELSIDRPNLSSNSMIECYPPGLLVFGFNYPHSQDALAKNYIEKNLEYPSSRSFKSYSKESRAYSSLTGDSFLSHSITVLDKGMVYCTFNGEVKSDEFGEYTLGMFLTRLLTGIEDISEMDFDPLQYLNNFAIKSEISHVTKSYANGVQINTKLFI